MFYVVIASFYLLKLELRMQIQIITRVFTQVITRLASRVAYGESSLHCLGLNSATATDPNASPRHRVASRYPDSPKFELNLPWLLSSPQDYRTLINLDFE